MHKTLGHAQTHTYTHACTHTHTHTQYTHTYVRHTHTHTQYTHTHAHAHIHTQYIHTHMTTHTFKRSRAIIQTCPKPTLCDASKPQEVHTTRIEHTPTQFLHASVHAQVTYALRAATCTWPCLLRTCMNARDSVHGHVNLHVCTCVHTHVHTHTHPCGMQEATPDPTPPLPHATQWNLHLPCGTTEPCIVLCNARSDNDIANIANCPM